ncbi:MAG: hypothetical protein A2Y92_05245 [Chloroflexi bacterium RBG_13_57_8]|nr:MAG: hypothetical protein A2Y92_05245 [Chloroflexi bacterium RBG_13_57_8]
MKERVKTKTEEKMKAPVETCHHYWVIEVANGPKSIGKCKYCDEAKEFLNAFPEFNPMRRRNSPLDLPKLPEVELDKESES